MSRCCLLHGYIHACRGRGGSSVRISRQPADRGRPKYLSISKSFGRRCQRVTEACIGIVPVCKQGLPTMHQTITHAALLFAMYPYALEGRHVRERRGRSALDGLIGRTRASAGEWKP